MNYHAIPTLLGIFSFFNFSFMAAGAIPVSRQSWSSLVHDRLYQRWLPWASTVRSVWHHPSRVCVTASRLHWRRLDGMYEMIAVKVPLLWVTSSVLGILIVTTIGLAWWLPLRLLRTLTVVVVPNLLPGVSVSGSLLWVLGGIGRWHVARITMSWHLLVCHVTLLVGWVLRVVAALWWRLCLLVVRWLAYNQNVDN